MKVIDEAKAKRICLSAKTSAGLVARVTYRFGPWSKWPDWAKDAFHAMPKTSKPAKPTKRRSFTSPIRAFRKAEWGRCFERAAGKCEVCGHPLGEEQQVAHVLEQSDRHRKFLGDYFVYSAQNQLAVCGMDCNHQAELKGTGENYVCHLQAVMLYLSTHPDVPVGLAVTDPVSRRTWTVKKCL